MTFFRTGCVPKIPMYVVGIAEYSSDRISSALCSQPVRAA